MALEAATIALLLKLTIHADDTGEEDRKTRITVLGSATVRAAQRATCEGEFNVNGCRPRYGDTYGLVAAMVALGEHESAFRRRIQAGECLAHECDPTKWHGVTIFQAQGPWQAHRLASVPLVEWQAMVGVDATSTQAMAWYSTKLFTSYAAHCRRGLGGGFSGYATGNVCFWDGEKALVQKAERYRKFLVRVAQQTAET
jgi:hypothetical protein